VYLSHLSIKVLHACFKCKPMHNPLAPLGNIRYLVRNSDTILVQHYADSLLVQPVCNRLIREDRSRKHGLQ
jgi:hypothetical protein